MLETMPLEVPTWVDKPLRGLLVIIIAAITIAIGRRLISRLSRRILAGTTAISARAHRLATHDEPGEPTLEQIAAANRREQRARTTSSVLRSLLTIVVVTIALLLLLDLAGINIAPILASAGIAGVAIGFGAQSLVKDFISGIFMLVEDQYGVGDVVDLGPATGTVEAVGLRVTRIRDLDGTLWYVRNGEVLRVGNKSQGWSRTNVEIRVPYTEDIPKVRSALEQVTAQLVTDPGWAERVFDEGTVNAYEELSADSVLFRVAIKTMPGKQWEVARELRRRIRAEFNRQGIEMAMPPILGL
jgi:small-conductance mechanosensitive channel